MGDCSTLGAAGVPFGAAKVEEAEVRLLLAERVRVDAQCQLGVRVPELRGDPSHALARRQREARVRVTGVMEAQGSHTSHEIMARGQPPARACSSSLRGYSAP